MAELQELISRGRFIFSGAPKRLDVFKLINGKKSTKDIAIKTGRSLSSVLKDFEKLRDMELIGEKVDNRGNVIKKGGATVYEKAPLVRHVSLSYFEDVANTSKLIKQTAVSRTGTRRPSAVNVPSDKEILDISKHGEDQLYEFKAPGVDTPKITREIAAFAHTKKGGIVFYGIDDDGIIVGSNMTRQKFDQKIHNTVQNTITPQPNIQIIERNVLGAKVIMIIISPWDRNTFYRYRDGSYYIRKGTNVFVIQPHELTKMGRGQYIA
jgi:hypothetical protein